MTLGLAFFRIVLKFLFNMSILKTSFFILFFLFSLSVFSQQGDKANEKDIISSLNWKKWSPEVVPVFSAEESLKQFKVAPGFKVELVASEPMVKDPVFVDWDDDGGTGDETACIFKRSGVYYASQLAPRVQESYDIDYLATSIVVDSLFGATLSHSASSTALPVVNFNNP